MLAPFRTGSRLWMAGLLLTAFTFFLSPARATVVTGQCVATALPFVADTYPLPSPLADPEAGTGACRSAMPAIASAAAGPEEDEGDEDEPPIPQSPRAASALTARTECDADAPTQGRALLSWTLASTPGTQQRVALSTRENGFRRGDYRISEPLPADATSMVWKPLRGQRVHYWKVLTLHEEGWISSPVSQFDAPLCRTAPDPQEAPVGDVQAARVAPLPEAVTDPACASTFTDINPDQSDLDANDPDGASGGRVNGLAAVAGNNQVFYLASEWGGIYRSNDQGLTWDRLVGHVPVAAWDVEVDPTNTQTVYATSFYDGRINPISGIEISYDGGTTWTHPVTAHPDPALEGTLNDNTPAAGFNCSNNSRTEPSAFGIGIRPDASNNVYIGTNCGLAISNDSGATWRFVDPTPGNAASTVWDVVVQAGGPTGQGIIDIIGADGHHRSTDDGANWTASNLPAVGGTPRSIAASSDESYVLVAAVGGTLLESDDAGATWTNLGRTDPIRGGGRIPFVETNNTTAGFDVWTGGVSLYRVACTTPAIPAQGGAARCPAGANPLPAGWFGGFTRGGTGAATGAHDDVGDVAFDSQTAVDAVPRLYSGDGGVFYAATTSAAPTSSANLVWEQPNRTPHGLWVYGMAGSDQPGDATEDISIGMQDNGVFANTNVGAANPTPNWHDRACCDGFDLASDDDVVLYTRGSFGNGRQFQLYQSDRGLPGFGEAQVNAYPAGGLVTQFNFAESIDTWGDDRFAIVMQDCIDTYPTDGQDNDNNNVVDDGGETNGCPGGVAGSDGGLFITNDIKAGPIVWTELGAAEPFGSNQMVQVRAAIDPNGVPTFYVTVGGGNGDTADQLWKFVGTNPAGTWARIDNNIPGATGVSVWGVNHADPRRLYAAATTAGDPQIWYSNDGGNTWTRNTQLEGLMTGAGAFDFLTETGPTEFTGFGGYPQPTLFAFDPDNRDLVLAAARDSGIFISRNGGRRFGLVTDPIAPATSGIPNIPRAWFAHFDHETGDANHVYVFVGTQGFGVWRITLAVDVPVLTVPGDLAFPDTCVGSSSVQTLNVCNTGEGCNNLLIDSITSSDPQFEVTEPSSGWPVEISPDFCFPFQVVFTPTSGGAQSAVLTIDSNDPEQPGVEVGVSGNGTLPDVRVTGSTDFGSVCAGNLAEKSLSVCNVGKCDLEVTSVHFEPACPDFTLVNNPFPAPVSPDSCEEVVIRFTPTSMGTKSCTLVIETNDPDQPIIMKTVTATTPEPVIDVPPDLGFPPEVVQSLGSCTTGLPFPVSNNSICPLTITNFAITAGSPEFSLDGLPSFPIILEPGHIAGEGDLQTVFAPTVVDRDRLGQVQVTYVSDPVTGATSDVTRSLCGEGVYTGARVLVTANGLPLATVEQIKLLRINANRNRNLLDTVETAKNLTLQTVNPAPPCAAFQYHREYGTVSNPIQLLPGSYQVTATAVVNGRRVRKSVGFDVGTCDFNPTIVINLP